MARKMLIVAGAVLGLSAAYTLPTIAADPDSHGSHSESRSSAPRSQYSRQTQHDDTTTTASSSSDRAPAASSSTTPAAPTGENAKPTADEALAMLTEGNARWVADRDTGPHTDSSRRQDTASNGQFPFATVVTCADSRIPVERVFDVGVGDLFVTRVAGNVASKSSEVGTIEYGVEHLHTPVLVIMGHTSCGAVGAACSGAHLHGNVGDLVANIYPAVDRAKRNNPQAQGPELVNAAVRENVWQTIFDLYRNSPDTRKLVKNGELKVVGAVYDIATGKVEWLGEHPWNKELAGAWDTDEPGEATPVTSLTPAPKPGETQASVPTDDGHGH